EGAGVLPEVPVDVAQVPQDELVTAVALRAGGVLAALPRLPGHGGGRVPPPLVAFQSLCLLVAFQALCLPVAFQAINSGWRAGSRSSADGAGWYAGGGTATDVGRVRVPGTKSARDSPQ